MKIGTQFDLLSRHSQPQVARTDPFEQLGELLLFHVSAEHACQLWIGSPADRQTASAADVAARGNPQHAASADCAINLKMSHLVDAASFCMFAFQAVVPSRARARQAPRQAP